jgi:hypothetical protein
MGVIAGLGAVNKRKITVPEANRTANIITED